MRKPRYLLSLGLLVSLGFPVSLGLLAWAASAFAAESPRTQTWSIAVTGGDGPENTLADFYTEARDYHSVVGQLGISPSNSDEFFGATGGLRCVLTPDFDYQRKTYDFDELVRRAGGLQADNCSSAVFDPMVAALAVPMKYLCDRRLTPTEIEAHPTLSSARVDPALDELSASTSSKENFLKSIRKVEGSLQPGDRERHLLLVLMDHGELLSHGSGSEFGFGNGDQITDKELEGITDRLSREGVDVHLVVDACYSGNFNHLTKTAPSGASVCSVASSDRATVSTAMPGVKSWPEALGQYGDQLEALGCLSGDSSFDRYTSGLDEVVQDWERTQPSLSEIQCPYESSVQALQTQLQSMIQPMTQALGTREGVPVDREKLIAAYRKYYIEPMWSCMKSGNRISEKALTWFLSCVRKKPENRDLAEFLKDFASVESAHSLQTVARQLRFLENAPPPALQQFKQVFCCLGFNFKTLKSPEICGPDNS